MPKRTTPLVNGEFYHLYNRGVEKRDIYLNYWDYKRFFKNLYYYQFLGPKPSFSKFTKSESSLFKPQVENKIIEIICYSLMPNHFHLLIRQLKDKGISIFMSQLLNSYTKYFNIKHQRVGPLFQGAFKAVLVETDEQLVHLSRYIHINPVVSGIAKNLDDYQWSSFSEYMSRPFLCSTLEILNFFPSEEKYREFIEEQIDYGITLEILKHQTLEEI
ncbi:MAG: transposase [Candidatus Daviesbacteria bacterium]|nr:transposase [Candidatus Daviesbacteria bacterium]